MPLRVSPRAETAKHIEIWPRSWPHSLWNPANLRSALPCITLRPNEPYEVGFEIRPETIAGVSSVVGEKYRVRVTDEGLGTGWWAFGTWEDDQACRVQKTRHISDRRGRKVYMSLKRWGSGTHSPVFGSGQWAECLTLCSGLSFRVGAARLLVGEVATSRETGVLRLNKLRNRCCSIYLCLKCQELKILEQVIAELEGAILVYTPCYPQCWLRLTQGFEHT